MIKKSVQEGKQEIGLNDNRDIYHQALSIITPIRATLSGVCLSAALATHAIEYENNGTAALAVATLMATTAYALKSVTESFGDDPQMHVEPFHDD